MDESEIIGMNGQRIYTAVDAFGNAAVKCPYLYDLLEGIGVVK